MVSNTDLTKKMLVYAKKHKLDIPRVSTLVQYWGKGKSQLAWRVSKHLHESNKPIPISQHRNKFITRWFFPEEAIRTTVMNRVHAELGTHEWPPGSNLGEVSKYLHSVGIYFGAPWCAAFVTWVLKHEGFRKFPPGPASADSWYLWAKAHKLLKPLKQSEEGDLWIWEWNNGDGMKDHIGFCHDKNPRDNDAYYIDGNVGAYGGSVTQSVRSTANIAGVIDLVKLKRLR